MAARARILETHYNSMAVVVTGALSREEATAAIEKVLPAPKAGTVADWAGRFYNTGIAKGKGVIWNFSA